MATCAIKSFMAPKAAKKKAPRINSVIELVQAEFAGEPSMRAGYANVGLAFDPNTSVSANAHRLSEKGVVPSREELSKLDVDASELAVPEDDEMQTWKDAMEIPEVVAKGRNVFLAPFERAYWQRLIAKHGENYSAMARDIKLNNYQHTQKTCEKKCAIFRELYNDNLSRKTPAPRRKELKKAAKLAAKAASSSAPSDSNQDSSMDESSHSESDIVADMDSEDFDDEISSDEEEFAPPPKKKFVASSSSKNSSKKHAKSK